MNRSRPQSSVLVDLKDPIQVHLLTETALFDSREYEILSQEEVDELKKQIQSLTQRIEQTEANLAIQAKYRDAAISMSKLYSPAGGKRRSLLGNRISGGDSAREAELEKQASERRCEVLAAELFSLEKRLMGPQRRLLQHTAGILQMTHRASARSQQNPQLNTNVDTRPNGIPGSPESLYTYTNGRNSLDTAAEGLYFDDRSLYLPLEELEGQPQNRTRKLPIQIPLKSQLREQQNQLRETEKLRDENNQLIAEMENLRKDGAGRIELISDAERELEDSNNALRELIVKLNPAKYQDFQVPPSANTNGGNGGPHPGDMVGGQLAYLGQGVAVALQELTIKDSERSGQADEAAASITANLAQVEGRIESLNRQLGDVLQSKKPDYPSPPEASESNLDDQLNYLQGAFRTVQTELSRAGELVTSSSASKQKTDQVEVVLMGLWDIIVAGYADIQQRKSERRQLRAEKGLEPDDEDMSADETVDPDEVYSLQAFSAKVQWLYAQATSLKEQKSVLKRQIKQQRELNNKSTSEKDGELTQTTEQLRETRDMLDKVEKEAMESQERLLKLTEDLDAIQQTTAANESASLNAAREQLMDRDARIALLESNGEELRNELSTVEASVHFVGTQLEEAVAAKNLAETRADKLQQEVKDKEDELERMNGLIIELKTEATIAKAELEGAYGSRAQRAAEAAKLTKSSENSELAGQVDKLRMELAGALKELEDITKDTITAEKDKLELEAQLDDVLADKASLEAEVKGLRDKLNAEVSRLREQLDVERLRVPPSPSGVGPAQTRAGTAMLSEQFRASMKEERKKHQEEVKVCLTPPPISYILDVMFY